MIICSRASWPKVKIFFLGLPAHRFILSIALSLGLIPCSSAFTIDNDVPDPIQNQLIQDLQLISTIKGSTQTPIHQGIFGELSGAHYMDYLNARISSIGYGPCDGQNTVACIHLLYSQSKLWITENYAQFHHPQIARIMVIFHESRHTEAKNYFWMHSMCPKHFIDENNQAVLSIWTGSPLAGRPSCDDSELGSYGSSAVLLHNISKFCSNCSEKIRLDAEIYSNDQIKRIINPISKQRLIDDFKSQL